jgi:hypothetical protein
MSCNASQPTSGTQCAWGPYGTSCTTPSCTCVCGAATVTITPTLTPAVSSTAAPTSTGALTPTPEPAYCLQNASITLSAPPSTSAGKISFKVKFQGAFLNNVTEDNNTQTVRVTLIKQIAEPVTDIGLQTISSKTFENIVITNTKTSDENGIAIWEGSFEPTAVVPGNTYSMLIKGPFHLQRKFCENNPTEKAEEGFPYICQKPGQISLLTTDNALNFSGVLLQGGDLPGGQGQDGVVNALDVSKVLNIISVGLGTSQNDVDTADMDFNGVVNVKDRSNILETLEEKYGDDESI